MEKVVRVCLLILASVLFLSCGTQRADHVTVLSGLLSWVRQDWSDAAVDFLRAAEFARENDDPLLHDYAMYGLASTYLVQDEYDAALVRLAEISPDAPEEIRAGVWYQIGIAAYRKGLYDQAATYFIKTLEIEPGSTDAKINLELCRRSISARESSTQNAAPEVSESRHNDDETEILFSLVRRKEQDVWRNRDRSEQPSGEEDY